MTISTSATVPWTGTLQHLVIVGDASHPIQDANGWIVAHAATETVQRYVIDALNSHGALVKALDNLVGPGAEHELTCDTAEHDDESLCIYCEGRAALALAEGEAPAPFKCALCGQVITDGKPCGCGARPVSVGPFGDVLEHAQVRVIVAALHTACSTYRECAATIAADAKLLPDAKARLVKQFESQEADAIAVLQIVGG